MQAQEKRANRVKSTKLVGQMLDAYYDDIKRAPEEGRKVAWVTGAPCYVLLKAMDIAYLHGEAYGATTAARKGEAEFKEAALAEGYLPEACSYSRITEGCSLFAKRGIPPGMTRPDLVMPKPDFVMTANPGCSTEINWLDSLARWFEVPSFLVDVPYVWREEDLPTCVAATTRQLQDFVTFLEDVMGCPYNWDRLKELVATLKEAATLRKEAMELCKNLPSPASFFDWSISLGPVNYVAGFPGTVEYYRQLKAELEERVAQGVGAVPNEKYRLLFDGILFWPKIGTLTEKFAARDTCVIGGRYTHLSFYHEPEKIDPERPLESIADYLVRQITNRTPQWNAEAVVNLCRDYSIDGLIIHAIRTCRPYDIPQSEIRDGVSRELGLPVAVFEGDHGDVDFYSDARVDTIVEALLETVATRKRAR